MEINNNVNNTVSFFLMGRKGLDVLHMVINKYEASCISEICCARDANVRVDYYEEIREMCVAHNIPFFDRKESFHIRGFYTIAVSWRWLIDLNSSTKLIVFHDSLLPRYRGFAPLVSSLINGEKQIGVSAIFAENEYDRGGIIAQSSTRITYPIKISEAIEQVSINYQEVADNIIDKIIKGALIHADVQDESLATYSLWRDEEDYRIDWRSSAEYIKRFVDAVGPPYKGASSYLNGEKVRINDVEVIEDVKIENRATGKVIFLDNQCPVVVCGKGLLKIEEITSDESPYSLIKVSKFRSRFA